MDKKKILEILHDWNFWKEELNSGINRKSYFEKCLRFFKTNVIVSIIGVRRAGKSYIMRQIIKNLIEKKVDKKNILMVNFEDQRFPGFYPKLLDEIYETYLEFLEPDKKPFIFLDEIHNVPKWERWVRTMHELGKAKIIVSGSSAKLLSGELATLLTGRHLDVFVSPLDFREFLFFKDLEIEKEIDLIEKKIKIKRFFGEYSKFGGFPEVVLSKEKKQLLLTYFEDILVKDIEKRYNVKEKEKLRALAKFYLTNISSTITFNSLRKFLNTTTNTIEKFSSYLEESNLIFFVKRFSFKIKEQEKSARKIYAIDVGLSNAVGFKFSLDYGKILENLVAIKLKKKKIFEPNTEIYYWQNVQKREVDFVVKQGQKIKHLIQVCCNIENINTKQREIGNLIKASKELKCNDLFVLTEDKEGEEKVEQFGVKRKIKFIPLWKWLLEN